MSSPDESKVKRPMSPLSKDYNRTVSEMETNDLLRITLTDESHTQKGDTKTCLLYGLRYFWRTGHCRDHLGLVDSSKQVQCHKPYPKHSYHSSEVVRELKERDTQVE